MDLVFGAFISLMIIFGGNQDTTQKIVSLDNDLRVKQIVSSWNVKNPDNLFEVSSSVGNHGRYKNIGLDYDYHKTGRIEGFAKKKGLKEISYNNFSFLIVESEETKDFIQWVSLKSPISI